MLPCMMLARKEQQNQELTLTLIRIHIIGILLPIYLVIYVWNMIQLFRYMLYVWSAACPVGIYEQYLWGEVKRYKR